ncbi:MAG: hypothetical protein KGZ57_02265 [Dethiobacter sp.]|nr:hypothetical protein [Dethiobacter sp.]
MLAIQAHCHEGHIQLPTEGLPRDARVVVLFLESEPANTPNGRTSEQQAALHLQSQSQFSQMVLLNPAEDCWNNV